ACPPAFACRGTFTSTISIAALNHNQLFDVIGLNVGQEEVKNPNSRTTVQTGGPLVINGHARSSSLSAAEATRRELRVIVVVVVAGDRELLQIVGADHSVRGFADLLDCRQQ